jgi:hypothetical protein
MRPSESDDEPATDESDGELVVKMPVLSPEIAQRPPTVVTQSPGGWSRLSTPTTILVSGAPGAGKNMLCDSWSTAQRGSPDPTEMSEDREDRNFLVTRSRAFWFPKKVKITLSVVPGQGRRPRAKAFEDRLTGSRTTQGAIHVVCWGYNQIWEMGDDSALVRYALAAAPEGASASEEVAAEQLRRIREELLERELKDLSDTLRRLEASWKRNPSGGTRRWLVIALTKCDLFWSQVDEAMDHYRIDPGSGARSGFGTLLQGFSNRVGPVDIHVLPVSTAPQAWEPDPRLLCKKEPEIEVEDSLVLMTEFFGRLEVLCGLR